MPPVDAVVDLTLPKITIERYPKLKVESRVSQLAVKLAKESFFGDDIMVQCTVAGYGKYPALPAKGMNCLKQTVFKLFPKYWSNPVEFEKTWKDCAEAVGQACKRLRLEQDRKRAVIID